MTKKKMAYKNADQDNKLDITPKPPNILQKIFTKSSHKKDRKV